MIVEISNFNIEIHDKFARMSNLVDKFRNLYPDDSKYHHRDLAPKYKTSYKKIDFENTIGYSLLNKHQTWVVFNFPDEFHELFPTLLNNNANCLNLELLQEYLSQIAKIYGTSTTNTEIFPIILGGIQTLLELSVNNKHIVRKLRNTLL